MVIATVRIRRATVPGLLSAALIGACDYGAILQLRINRFEHLSRLLTVDDPVVVRRVTEALMRDRNIGLRRIKTEISKLWNHLKIAIQHEIAIEGRKPVGRPDQMEWFNACRPFKGVGHKRDQLKPLQISTLKRSLRITANRDEMKQIH